MRRDEAILRLTVDVRYDLGRTDIKELEAQLVRAADHLAAEGLLSGDTEASATCWTSKVTQPDESETEV